MLNIKVLGAGCEACNWVEQQAVAALETLMERPPGGGGETVLWSCSSWEGAGECESNGLFYDASRDSFLFSFYSNASIVELDHASGAPLWWAGSVHGGYDFRPPASTFSWQHGVSWTSSGTLLVSTLDISVQPTTMLREYQVDEQAGTLTEVWSYDPGIHARTGGDAHRLPNGDTLHVVGDSGHILEVDPQGQEVWHVDFGGNYLLGRAEFIEDLYGLVGAGGSSR